MAETATKISLESKRLTRRLFASSIVWSLFVALPAGFDPLSAQTQTSSSKPSQSPSSSSAKQQTSSSSTKKKGTKQVAKKRAPRGQREIESSRVIEIQNALATAGFYKEQPSGNWDPSTTEAMSAYQESNGFKVTGKPDALSLKKLGL